MICYVFKHLKQLYYTPSNYHLEYTCNYDNFQIPAFFRIVNDNIDYSINPRIQSKDHTNKFIHCIQQYAILDRVNEPEQMDVDTNIFQLMDLLPTKDVQVTFKQNCAILVSRLITKFLTSFNCLSDAVICHIDHPHIQKQLKNLKLYVRFFLICCLL